MTTFTTHAAGQTITAADINAIQTAVVALEGKVAPNAALHGFLGWSLDPAMTVGTNNGSVGTEYALGVYLPSGTVTNLHCYVVVGAVTTHFAMGLYTAAGALLSQTADKTSDGNVTGLKTYALGTPQVVTSGYYYIVLAFTGASPTFLAGPGTTAAIINASNGSPPVSRAASSGTAYATTLSSPLGTLSAVGKPYWVACS